MVDNQKLEEYQRLLDTFKTIGATVYYYALKTKTISVTQGMERIFGCTKQQFNKDYWEKALHPEDKDKLLEWNEQLLAKRESSNVQYRIIRGDNEERWIEEHRTPWINMFGELEGFLGFLLDITNRKELEQRVEYMAFHDTLTGLPNRNLLNEYSLKVLARCKRRAAGMAVLYLDLDKFKLINDTLGHNVGDLVLKQVAERLNRCVRDGDIVSRQGGDEFVILLEDTDREGTEQVVQRILASVATPFTIQKEAVYLTASIGISLYPSDGEDINTLMSNADEAMYIAKEHGSNLYYFYQTDLNNEPDRQGKLVRAMRKSVENNELMLVKRVNPLTKDLSKAIENNELTLYYQPLINFYTGDIIGMEALLRWFHPTLGLILPLEFIPIAEESGQIGRIGEWVLEKACTQNKYWQSSGLNPVKIIVNVSNYQFRNPDFLNLVKGVLIKTGLDPEYLELDITEGFMRQNVEEALPVAQELTSLGVKVSVEDFGTGVFSFNVLNKLPIEYLKIGKNLIHDLADRQTSILIKTIIQMGKSLNLKPMAQGIENKEHIEFLKANDCFLGQGNYYSPPVPAEEASELLKSFQGWKSKYGSLETQAAAKIKKYEEENKKLKQILAELTLGNHLT
jgi:diguanylate cyclase (GGDEF)-like protein/PAS domain S-box-containing protein